MQVAWQSPTLNVIKYRHVGSDTNVCFKGTMAGGRRPRALSPGSSKTLARLQDSGDLRESESRRGEGGPRSGRSWRSQLAGQAPEGKGMAQERDFRNGLILVWATKAQGSLFTERRDSCQDPLWRLEDQE